MNTTKSLFAGLFLLAGVTASGGALASGGGAELHTPEGGWSFEGVIGAHYDREAAQRGFQVYKEVCSSCHSLKYVSFRTLEGIGFNEAEVKAIAAGYFVQGEPDDTGEVNERAGLPSDNFPSPYANPEAAAFANNGAVPPDLSLIVKAREGGASYVYSLLTGYREPTEEDVHHLEAQGLALSPTSYFNPIKDGMQIAMAPPLSEGVVEYAEGQPQATVEQMAHDVATFLAWTAEPKLEERKDIGFKFMVLLIILCGLLYFSYRRVAKRVLGH